ncbi:type IV secretion system protein [Belnapia rosea]|uniref:Type IV secretion system protein n=1 Tax=Belnapia rosea TaxID=938405 RepID=A0A1G7BVL2_9PROT|nr:type IV secretion system protein [Belnapia rosea]SDE31057.1 Type IV secretion system protein [Belnapia rosea]
MRKRILTAGVAALALAVASVQPAHAILGVGDVVFDPAALEQALVELEEMQRHYQVLQGQLRQAENLYNSLSHTTDIAGLANVLRSAGLRLPLPIDSAAFANLLSGRGSSGDLVGLLRQFSDRNRVYDQPGSDFAATELRRNRDAIAGRMAAARQLYDTTALRATGLAELQNRLTTATDPAEKMDLIARVGAEQAAIQNLQVQAQAVTVWASAEDRNAEQRRQEADAQSLDATADALLAGK